MHCMTLSNEQRSRRILSLPRGSLLLSGHVMPAHFSLRSLRSASTSILFLLHYSHRPLAKKLLREKTLVMTFSCFQEMSPTTPCAHFYVFRNISVSNCPCAFIRTRFVLPEGNVLWRSVIGARIE